MIVWMATARKGASYHTLTGDRRTPCGRWYGGQDARPERGLMMSDTTAEFYGGVQCKRCFGLVEVHAPSVVRTGRP